MSVGVLPHLSEKLRLCLLYTLAFFVRFHLKCSTTYRERRKRETIKKGKKGKKGKEGRKGKGVRKKREEGTNGEKRW